MVEWAECVKFFGCNDDNNERGRGEGVLVCLAAEYVIFDRQKTKNERISFSARIVAAHLSP